MTSLEQTGHFNLAQLGHYYFFLTEVYIKPTTIVSYLPRCYNCLVNKLMQQFVWQLLIIIGRTGKVKGVIVYDI